jgi:hypothetical protein
MTKNYIVLIVLLVIVAGILFFWLGAKPSTLPTKAPATTGPTPTVKYLTWTDEAGFVFEYPEGVSINNHPEDNLNYANLSLTAPNQSGTIAILMQDDIYKSLGTWITKSSAFKDANILDTSLGDKDAKKILTANGQTIIGVIDSGVLVTLQKEGTLSPLLESTWSKITDSWAFVYPTPTTGKTVVPAVSDDSGDILEEF